MFDLILIHKKLLYKYKYGIVANGLLMIFRITSSVPPVVIPTLQCNTNTVKQQQRTIGPK